jgi:hypothetical protein
MFGFIGGWRPDVVTPERVYMAEARITLASLTHFDASTTKNDRQLVTMVKERRSLTHEAAESDVLQWIEDKVF